MLIRVFGPVKAVNVKTMTSDDCAGFLELENARVSWFLSVNSEHIPNKISGRHTYRSLTMEGEEIEFSDGFTDLHTKTYDEILKANGFGLADARSSIGIVHQIRNSQ